MFIFVSTDLIYQAGKNIAQLLGHRHLLKNSFALFFLCCKKCTHLCHCCMAAYVNLVEIKSCVFFLGIILCTKLVHVAIVLLFVWIFLFLIVLLFMMLLTTLFICCMYVAFSNVFNKDLSITSELIVLLTCQIV